jgi:hypothetical protein
METNHRYIYGPSVGFRVSMRNKIIHIYGECHSVENVCPYPDSISISQYINQQIKLVSSNTVDKMAMDIFVELDKGELVVNNSPDTLSKISTVLASSMKIFKNDNVRIHSGDIRDIISPHSKGFYTNSYSKLFKSYLSNLDSIQNDSLPLQKLRDGMNKLYSRISRMKDILMSNVSTNLIQGNKNSKLWEIVCYKIRNSSLKDISVDTIIPYMNNVLDTLLLIMNNMDDLLPIVNKFDLMTLNDKYKMEILLVRLIGYFDYLSLERTYVLLFQRINDIFFIRRIVDTEKITNVIMYYGAIHVQFILAVLVKYFDAKILNSTTTKMKSLSSTKDDLNKYEFEDYYDKVSFRYDILDNQCIDIKEFPDMVK